MIFVRFHEKEPKAPLMKGVLDGDFIRRVYGSIFQGFNVTNECYSSENVAFLPPLFPSNVVCFGNGHLADYIKTPSSLNLDSSVRCLSECYCIPRICYIIDSRVKKRYVGYQLMLDFVNDLFNIGFSAASPLYTVVSKELVTNDDRLELFLNMNGQNTVRCNPPAKEKFIDELFKLFKPIAGDMVCIPLIEPFICKKNETVELFSREAKIEASLKEISYKYEYKAL